MKKLSVNKNPCSTCPYRKDVPSGVWAEEEYEKLRGYDDPQTNYNTFLCHQSPVTGIDAACKGWVMVHANSVAVRLACIIGALDPATCFEEPNVDLYASGNEAADAGEAQIDLPERKALKAINKLKKTGRFKE